MNMHWRWHDQRLDAELAVALEAVGMRLAAARCPAQLEAAIRAALRLWRAVRALAERCSALDDRELLAETADHMAVLLVADARPCPDPRDIAFVAGRGLSLARDLAGEAASGRARDRLMAEWSASSRLSFEDWLVDRLRVVACPPKGGGTPLL
ncbi:MAG: hypothetical protein AB1918_04680 [Pseudomonadota bacterium]